MGRNLKNNLRKYFEIIDRSGNGYLGYDNMRKFMNSQWILFEFE